MKLLIGTPCYNGTVTTQYMSSVLQLQAVLRHARIDFSLTLLGSESLITRARNFIVSQFLGRAQFTHLLFIDADIGFDPEIVPRYLKANKGIVAGVYPLKNIDLDAVRKLPSNESLASTFNYAVKLVKPMEIDSDDFAKAEYAATGFMLIRRDVLNQMAEKYSHLRYHHSFTKNQAASELDESNFYAFFDTSLVEGSYLPEDYTFCHRWRAIGGDIWVDLRSQFKHVWPYSFDGNFSSYIDTMAQHAP
jgi:hypothetical protein